MNKDIQPIVAGWEFKPKKISARKIRGFDGSMKLQLRLDLGILQMELHGRPDGQKPFGYESLLEYYNALLCKHKRKFSSTQGFRLESDDCAELQRESIQYYHRYLSLFQLGDYKSVERDTARNLRVFDLVKEYAADENDVRMFEQYRPYVIMMNVRAKVHINLKANKYATALHQLSEAIEAIRLFFDEYGQSHLSETCREIIFLENWSKEIHANRPLSKVENLQRQMDRAVEKEEYERAADLRDKLKDISQLTEVSPQTDE